MSLFRNSDYTRKKEPIKKTKLPTQAKSKKVFCRNCNKQNTEFAKVCIQCEITIREPKLRRKMK